MSLKSKKVAESEFNSPIAKDSALWPEWSDAALNKENWSSPKNGTDGLFMDTRPVDLPPSLEPSEWIRAKNLKNLTEPLTVFVATSEYPDLITNNGHILRSEVRPDFRKYVVRLFFLGSWRYIIVDDMIPVNSNGVPVLPRTSNDHELWPLLLSKALLKLCSVSWSDGREIVDFHPVHCLTGWICLRLEIGYLSPQDKWDFLRKYADHFEWKAETEEVILDPVEPSEGKKSKATSKSKKSKDTEDSQNDAAESKKSKETGRSKKSKDTERSKKSKGEQKPVVLEKPEPVTLFLGLDDMKTLASGTVPGLSPCWSHFIYIAQSRDVPLDPKDVKPPLARWKLFRWLKWAIEMGIIDPVEYFVPIRSLKIVSPLKEFDESVVSKYTLMKAEETNQEDIPASEKSEKKNRRDKSKESKSQKESSKKSPGKVEEVAMSLPDISFWADFNKLEPYIRDVHFFYKLDYFEYTARISDRFQGIEGKTQKSESKKSGKTGSRGASPEPAMSGDTKFVDAYQWPRGLSRSRNEPLYIFTDSTEIKFFLISFATFQMPGESQPPPTNSRENSVDPPPVPGFAQSTANRDYLIIERHSWFHRQKYGNDLVHLPTAGTKATVMELESGRHLLRVYCGSEANCFTTISSDTIFHVGDRWKMYELMTTESDTIEQKVKHISNCVSNAYQSFGTERFPEAMKLYYKSFMPPGPSHKKRIKIFHYLIHVCFLSEKARLIKELMPKDEVPGILRALKILYLDPLIGQQVNPFSLALKAMRDSSTPRTSIERTRHLAGPSIENNTLNNDYFASIIQSFFRRIVIRKYKRIHNPKHEEHQEVMENLLKVVELFNYNKRESLASCLFRCILKHFDRLRDIYPSSKDFEFTIQKQELTGTLSGLKPGQWTPIVRLLVNARVQETVFASVDLFVNLPRYCVRVFNNDTKREMLRVVNNVVPSRYEHNSLGYTVFAYGWTDDQPTKDVPWCLLMVTKKTEPIFYTVNNNWSSNLQASQLVTQELTNYYIPNNKGCIAKWIARVTQPTVVSFRLITSYDKVKVHLRVMDLDEDTLSEIYGISVVILPFTYLGLSVEPSTMHLNVDSSGQHRLSDNNANDNQANQVVTGDGSGDVKDRQKSDVNGGGLSARTLVPQTYYVEAFALDESWPLSKSEWAIVTQVKSRRAGSTVRPKASTVSLSKPSKSESSRFRRTSRIASEIGQPPEKPYWILQVVTDSGSGFEIAEDKSKEEKIAKMKEAWFAENPDSMARGKLLREEFRKKYEIKPEASEMDTRRRPLKECCPDVPLSMLESRSLEPPRSFRKLPLLKLSDYEVKEDEEDVPWLKTIYDEEILRNTRLAHIIYAQEDYNYSIEELSGLIKNRKERYRMLFQEHQGQLSTRRTIVEEAYELRKSYIASMQSESGKGSRKSMKTRSSKSKKA
ncbi:androglobin [Augochlora pura]